MGFSKRFLDVCCLIYKFSSIKTHKHAIYPIYSFYSVTNQQWYHPKKLFYTACLENFYRLDLSCVWIYSSTLSCTQTGANTDVDKIVYCRINNKSKSACKFNLQKQAGFGRSGVCDWSHLSPISSPESLSCEMLC